MPENENKVTEILQHQIEWFLRGNDEPGEKVPDELDECSIEHIKASIEDGYNQGELCVTANDGDKDHDATEYFGWWSIKSC